MKTKVLLLNAALVVVAAVLSPARSNGQEVDRDWMQQIERSFKRNAERTKTLIVDWNEVRSFPKDSLSEPDSGALAPASDTEVKCEAQLMLDGDKVSYRRSGKQWSWRDNNFVPWEKYTVTNTKASKELIITDGMPRHPVGFIHKDTAFSDGLLIDLMPILWSYRAMEKCYGTYGFTPADWNVSSDEVDTNGLWCVTLKRTSGRTEKFVSLAIDHEFSPKKFWIAEAGQTRVELEIDHKISAKDEWSIGGWRIKWLNRDGTAGVTTVVKVTEFQLNVPTPSDYFEVKFPVGTEVNDFVDNAHYFVGKDGAKEEAVLNPDGTRR